MTEKKDIHNKNKIRKIELVSLLSVPILMFIFILFFAIAPGYLVEPEYDIVYSKCPKGDYDCKTDNYKVDKNGKIYSESKIKCSGCVDERYYYNKDTDQWEKSNNLKLGEAKDGVLRADIINLGGGEDISKDDETLPDLYIYDVSESSSRPFYLDNNQKVYPSTTSPDGYKIKKSESGYRGGILFGGYYNSDSNYYMKKDFFTKDLDLSGSDLDSGSYDEVRIIGWVKDS